MEYSSRLRIPDCSCVCAEFLCPRVIEDVDSFAKMDLSRFPRREILESQKGLGPKVIEDVDSFAKMEPVSLSKKRERYGREILASQKGLGPKWFKFAEVPSIKK
ncbi:hypothetical protein CDAR_467761 [Caerostris darwini]|uniref:Uncharacterized protein n=1 Tax=Caerostris darwini TaxID=1538125 RepID=A0AAV4SN65_9ARAC|nr:hypothetical protein CDAR_467761 [Caerostris darwini]